MPVRLLYLYRYVGLQLVQHNFIDKNKSSIPFSGMPCRNNRGLHRNLEIAGGYRIEGQCMCYHIGPIFHFRIDKFFTFYCGENRIVVR